MKDFRGKPLAIGDRVATEVPYYKGLVIGEVVAFTPKMIRVKVGEPKPYEKNEFVVPSSHVSLLND